MSADERPLTEGDIIQRKYPRTTVRWTVVAVEDKRVRFKVESSGHRFWIGRETADRYWLPDRVPSK